MSHLRRFVSNRDGNFSVFAAIGTGLMVLSASVALDATVIFKQKQSIQDAADQTALAAAIYMSKKSSEPFKSRAVQAKEIGQNSFISNFKGDVAGLTDVKINITDGKVVVSAKIQHDILFGKAIGKNNIDIIANATSVYASKADVKPCLMALSTTKSPGISVNESADIQSPNCEVHIHSNGNPAFTINNALTFDFSKICVSGNHILDNNRNIDNIHLNCAVSSDPYFGQIPIPDSTACDYTNGNYSATSLRMRPGVYCGWHNFNNGNAKVEFDPGVYILKNGGWTVNGGEWSGDDVTFYFADRSKIQFNSAVSANFTAPKSGSYAGIFITETASSFRDQFVINDSKGFIWDGAVYLPNREVVMNSGSDTSGRRLNIVADSLIFNDTKLSIENDTANTAMATSPLLSE